LYKVLTKTTNKNVTAIIVLNIKNRRGVGVSWRNGLYIFVPCFQWSDFGT